MLQPTNFHVSTTTLLITCISYLVLVQHVDAQSGIRESLERLDTNENGEIDPDEITPLSRPYLERIARARRLSLDRSNDIERFQEAARIYAALANGVDDDSVRPSRRGSVKPFGPVDDEPLVPEFGIPEVKYPYTDDDLDEADRTLRRADWNEDGFIDRREARYNRWTHRDPFEMDLDQDDRLSRMELVQRYARRRLLDQNSDELRRKAWRTGGEIEPASRKDDDDRESSSWWRSGGTSYYLTASVLGRFDRNRDGRLEAGEAASLGIPFGRLDVDRDGELTREELHAYLADMQKSAGDQTEGLPGWFYELDTNRDGQLEMSEYAVELTDDKLQEFVAIDTNGDALLVPAEVVQSMALVGGSYRNDTAEVLPPRKTIISEIEVEEDYPIGDLNVQVSITHSHVAYLDAYLTGPDGTRVELFSEIGSSGDNFDRTVFDDQSRYPINKARPPYRGTFMPGALTKKQPGLEQFNGQSVKGIWQLVVRASRSDRFGMLHGWALVVKPVDDMLDSEVADTSSSDGPQEASRTAYASRSSSSERESQSSDEQSRTQEARTKTMALYMQALKREDLSPEKRKWLEAAVSSGGEKDPSLYPKKSYSGGKSYEGSEGYTKKSGYEQRGDDNGKGSYSSKRSYSGKEQYQRRIPSDSGKYKSPDRADQKQLYKK